MHNTSTHSKNHSQDKKKKKKRKKRKKERKRTLLSFFLNLNFLFVATRVALIPQIDFVALLSDELIKLFLLIKSTFVVLMMRSKY